MSQPKHRSQCPQPVGRFLIPLVAPLNLYKPIVVRIASKARQPVRRYLVLEVDFGDGWPVVMGMQVLVGCDMFELDTCHWFYVREGFVNPVKVG